MERALSRTRSGQLPLSDERSLDRNRRPYRFDHGIAVKFVTQTWPTPSIGTPLWARPDCQNHMPEMRRDEAQFWREFEQVRPRILGALLDAATAGLGNLPNVRLDQVPRMADFAIWVSACKESLGNEPR